MIRTSSILVLSIIALLVLQSETLAQSIAFEEQQFKNKVTIDEVTGDTIQTFFYPGGEKRSEGRLSNSMREGLWTTWYSNGRIWMLGNFHQHQVDGEWRYWNDGLRMAVYYMTGELFNGSKHGLWSYYYENRNKEREGEWNQDKRTGIWKFWWEGGQRKRNESWAGGLKNGLWEFWHVNGQKEREEHYNGGVKHGTWTYWYANGNLERKENWQGGRMHGLWTFWYESGQIDMQGTFINDRAAGEWTTWYESGEKKMEGILEADAQEDEWTYWYPNSNKKARVTYNRGDIIGVRLLRKRPVNYDRRPEIISSSNNAGSYRRESRKQLHSNAPSTEAPQDPSNPDALKGVNDPVTIPQSRPNSTTNTERVSGFSESTSSSSVRAEKPTVRDK
jgi:antitoxin component YwqK of YwqJK toxin-antitoxin module